MTESLPQTAPPATATTESTAAGDKYTEALRRFSSDLRMARQVWQSMHDRGVAPQEQHYKLYLDAHLSGRDAKGAAEVAEQMRAAGFATDPRLRWDLALTMIRGGDQAAGREQLARLQDEGVQPPDELLPKLFSFQMSAGDLAAARATLRQMAAKGLAAQPAEYRVLFRDVLTRRAIKDGKALVDAMLKAGVTPETDDLADLVSMMARAGHPDRAELVAGLAMQAGVALPQAAVAEVGLAYARKNDVERARTVLGVIESAGGHISSYVRNGLLAAVGSSGDADAAWDEAIRLADVAVPSGTNLEMLFDLAQNAGNWRRALGAIDWMLILGVPAPANKVADAIGALLKHGELDEALALYHETTRRGVPADRRRAKDLTDALVKSGRLDEARAFLAELRKDKTLTNGRHYGTLLAALVKAHRRDDAMAVLQEMLDDDVAPTVADASRMAMGLIKADQLDLARELVGKLADAKIGVDEETYRELMWAYARKGRAEETQAVFDRMVAAGITPDDRHHKALQWASGETARRLDDTSDIPRPTPGPPLVPAPGAAASPTPESASEPQPEPAPESQTEPQAEPAPEPEPDA